MADSNENLIGTLDWPMVESIFRKAAFCRAFTSEMYVSERKDFMSTFKTLETPPPRKIRAEAQAIYRQNVRQLAEAIYEGRFVAMGKLIVREMCAIDSKGREMREAFEKVHKHNADTMWWLTFGQYTAALMGMAAGVALVVVATGGAISLAAAAATGTAAEATFLTLSIGGGAIKLTGTSIACNVAISTTRGWSDAQSWQGLAVGGIEQSQLELKRQGAGYTVGGTAGVVEQVLINAGKSVVDPESLGKEFVDMAAKNASIAKNVARVGFTALPLIFASIDLQNEIKVFNKNTETPQERTQRMQNAGKR